MLRYASSLIALAVLATPALAGDSIHIVGSSTVYPFTATVAEQFAKKTNNPAPIVEATGTGGGVKMFCAGDGLDTPDAVNASRPMKPEEVAACKKNGVTATEVAIGIDAIILAMSKEHPQMRLTTQQIYTALAKYVMVDGEFIPNPVEMWSDIDPSLPNERVEVLGPPPTSGTRDSFVELVIEKECKKAIKAANLTLSEEDEKSYCKSIRDDGKYVEAGENDNLIVQKLQANPHAFGIFGYSFLEQNASTIQGVVVNDVAPEYDTIAAGEYPISRKLFVYFKDSHLEAKPELVEFMKEYQSEEAIGEDGYLIDKGLIPLGK